MLPILLLLQLAEIDFTHLEPVKKNLVWLTEAIVVVAHNVKQGVWNKGVMDVFLCYYAVATIVRQNIWVLCCLHRKSQMKNDNDDEPELVDDGEIDDSYAPLTVDSESNIVSVL